VNAHAEKNWPADERRYPQIRKISSTSLENVAIGDDLRSSAGQFACGIGWYEILDIMRGLTLLCFALALRGDDSTQKLVKRLGDEAAAFQKIAPQLVGRETMHQRALAPPRFKMRVGDAAKQPQAADWKEHEIVSEYAFALLGRQIHELRQVTSVDGKRVAGETQAQDALAKLITASDEERQRRALQQLEKYGLRGGATDFGQILLLFSRGNVERYEFTAAGPRLMGTVATQVFHYQQLDGPQALTVFRGNSGAATTIQRLSVQGEIWVREEDGLPVRITMTATNGSDDKTLREEATVDYAMSRFGTLLPVETTQRELRAGEEVAENKFGYRDFHRFEARPTE
jgi:hypothetical protein